MKHMIGYWGKDIKKFKDDRKILDKEIAFSQNKMESFVLDRNVKDLEAGEYIFQVKKTITSKNGCHVYFVIPYKDIIVGCMNTLHHYLYDSMHHIFKKIFLIYEEKKFETPFDHEDIHFAMRILRSMGYDWVPEEHTPKDDMEFCHAVHDKMLSGEFNMFSLYRSCVKDVDLSGLNGSILHGKETPFCRPLPFDPKYDKLVPFPIPDRLKTDFQSFVSSDIGARMYPIQIANQRDLDQFKKYIHPDVIVKIHPDGIFAGYKIPEKGSTEYEKMISGAKVSDFYAGLKREKIFTHVNVPSSVDPSKEYIMGVSDNFYPDILQDVLDHFHLHKEVSDDGITLNCDEDYEVTDFEVSKNFSIYPKDYVDIKFVNGIRGYYKAKDVLNTLKGNCVNAKIYRSDYNLGNVQIVFEKKEDA